MHFFSIFKTIYQRDIFTRNSQLHKINRLVPDFLFFSYLRNSKGPPGRLSSIELFKTVKVLVEQFESFSSHGETIGVSSFAKAPNGSFSVTGVLTGLFTGDS